MRALKFLGFGIVAGGLHQDSHTPVVIIVCERGCGTAANPGPEARLCRCPGGIIRITFRFATRRSASGPARTASVPLG